MDLSMGGYYRLCVNGVVMLEDSACEDYYDFDSARASFTGYINEYDADIAEFIEKNADCFQN